MSTGTLNSKRQVTIPIAVRTALGVGTGDRVEFIETAPGYFELVAATRSVTALKGLVVEDAEIVWKAVRLFKAGNAEFGNCLIDCSANQAGCDYTATFDRGAARQGGMRLIV